MSKKILLLTHEYPPNRGGAGVYCEELAYAANKKKINLEVWAPEGSIKSCNFDVKELPWKGTHSWVSSWRLVSKLLKLKFQSESINCIHLAELGSLRAFVRFGWRMKNFPQIIITIHGSELLKFTANPIEKWLFKKLLHQSVRIHVLSKYNEEKLKLFCPEIKDKVFRLPGAPARRMVPSNQITSYSDSSNFIKILTVGRIHPRKGQAELLHALNRLPLNLQKQIIITFVGPYANSTYQRKIEKEKENFNGKVIFTGDIEDHELHKKYQEADLFALTSTIQKKSVEGFGFVYLEASAHGLPILAHRTGGVEDAVLENKTGLLANPKSIESLAERLETLVSDSKLRDLLGKNGMEWARSHSWGNIGEKLYNIP